MTKPSHSAVRTLLEHRQILNVIMHSRLADSSSGRKQTSSSTFPSEIDGQIDDFVLTLAACIEFSSPSLFQDYFDWTANVAETASSRSYQAEEMLNSFLEAIRTRFPRENRTEIENWIEKASHGVAVVGSEGLGRESENPQAELQQHYLTSLLAAHRDRALEAVLGAIHQGVTVESIYLDIIQPSQRELGRLWQVGAISVAQEHYCTAATQFIMSQLQSYFLTNNRSGKSVLATCIGDELHEVGLRIVADLFELHGWNTVYLGANTPAPSIVQELVSNGSQILAISTTMTRHLFKMAELISSVRSQDRCTRVKILVGGYPFNVDPYLWRRVGADAGPIDARSAIEIAERFVKPLAAGVGEVDRNPALRPPDSSQRFQNVSVSPDDDLSRLNNELVTVQRMLTKANIELQNLYRESQEKSDALQLADRRKDEFLAMLAHELRGPLAPMQLAVALLQMDDIDISTVKEARETLKRQLQQMTRLISDLLDASRLAHGKIELKIETLELRTVVQRALEIAHPLMSEKDQEVIVDIRDDRLRLDGDLIRLAQVFANLLTNASKYTGRQGTIGVTIRRVRDTAVVEIRDNGVGIEPELLKDIFSTFTQEERSRKHSKGGLGLGLSLVKQLVELHQGSVSAQSEGAGKGSTFSVTLPVLESAEEPVEPAGHLASTWLESNLDRNAVSRSVLVVEDIAGIAKMTASLLRHFGHSPMIAANGETAIRKFQELVPEIVILDLELPDMNGLDVAKEMRRLDANKRTLIVALTGHADDQHRILAEESGCDEYLVKPVAASDLAQLASHPKLLVEKPSMTGRTLSQP